MATMVLKLRVEMALKQLYLIPTVLTHNLHMATSRRVKILAILVRADHTAMDLAHLNLLSKMVPRIPLNLALRRTLIFQLKALVRLKRRIMPYNSLSVGIAAIMAVVIRPIAMDQIVQESPAILL